LPYPGAWWQPTLLMLLLGGALGLFQLPLIVGVQSTVGWSERGTTTASVLFCRQTGQTLGASLFGAVANGVLAARLGGAGDLDSVTRALDAGTAPEATRRAIADAVHAVYLGAAGAAALAFVVLLLVAPRRFPVLPE
ncbi:MFS transporter, partial [Streptomyces sp. UMAF16]|nr:MFS transporter [Streptomyces sp. UMAF16]